MSLGGWLIPFLLLNIILFAAPLPQTETTFKVGAWGDDASRNNLGVQVEIETRTYNTPQNTLNYFWVGDDLSDGAFIQFGYSLEPGTYCLRGAVLAGTFKCQGPSESILSSDARWQWQYWPDRTKQYFYYEIGPPASAGPNATSHEYTISPSSSNTWNFMLDGRTVEATSFSATPSTDPAFVVAEASATNESQLLGPVQFAGLSYFNGTRWRFVDSLLSLSYCGISVACVANQYGAIAIGPDSILAGSGIPKSPDGTLLWTSEKERLLVQVHPGIQFFVTSSFGTQTYEGDAEIMVPKGMFAYISLFETDTSTMGLLGWLGGHDRFEGWTGSVNSPNLTAQVLMDSNKNVTAVWRTDASVPTVISLVTLVFVLGIATRFLMKRRLKAKKQAGFGMERRAS
jgi:hypothetical protein